MRKSPITQPIILLVTAIALAGLFVYYPLTLSIIPQPPGLVFEPGSNANQPDIGVDKVIEVALGANATSATIRVHPTYRQNYYKDVLRIRNSDDNAMYVHLMFESVANTLPVGSVVNLFLYEDGVKVVELDITSPTLNMPIPVGQISSGQVWQLDLYVYIPEGSSIEGASFSATLRLVYTPTPEAPPRRPKEGRYMVQPKMVRVSRGGLAYTDFESFPELGWNYSFGVWSLVSGVEGAKGNCLRSDGEGYYWWNTGISGYQSLWTATRLKRGGGTRDVLGMFVSGRTLDGRRAMYRIMVDVPRNELWVEVFILFRPPSDLVRASIQGDISSNFFTLVVNYVISEDTITLRFYVYDVNGDLAGIAITSCATTTQCTIDADGALVVVVGRDYFVRPSYAGIYLRYPSGYFDGFVISTIDPRTIVIEGLEPGMLVEVWDNLGGLVASGVATGDRLELNVVQDFVVGTGANGRIVIKRPDGTVFHEHMVPSGDAIIGGDTYRIEIEPV